MQWPLFCQRCARELTPGAGDFFVVSIQAVADPTAGPLELKSAAETRAEMERLLAQLEDVSPQEALDQVYRRVTLYLCNACFRKWIENPTGE
jgi:hypothetical protein